MSQIKKLAGQTAIYGLSSIVGRLLNYLLVPLYTRIFDPAQYGVVSEFYAIVTFLIVLYTYGLETALFRFSSKSEEKEKVYSNSLFMILFSSSLFSGVLILFSSKISNALGYPSNANYIIWFALILAFDALTALPFARLRQEGRAKKFAFLKLLNIFSNIVFNLFFLLYLPVICKANPQSIFNTIYDPTIGVGYVFIANLIASGVTFIFLVKEYSKIVFPIDKVLIKEIIIYSIPLLIAGFAGMINETLDRAILKYLTPNKATAMYQLGIYSACYKLSILLTLFVQTFRYASEPFFFSNQNKEGSKELYAKVMDYFVFICSLIFLFIMLYLDIIKGFIGKQFHEGLFVVPILLMANLFLGIYLNLSIWYKLSGQTKYGAWFSMIGALITISMNFALIPIYGYLGAAWATLICYGAMMIMSYWIGQKFYPIPYHVKNNLLFIVGAVVVWLVSKYSLELLPISISAKINSSTGIVFAFHSFLLLLYIGFFWKRLNPNLKFNK